MPTTASFETRRRGFIGQLFIVLFFAFNALMLVWLLSYWVQLAGLDNGDPASRVGLAIGGTIGTGMLFFFWATGALILGLCALLTRGRQIIVLTEPGTPKISSPQFGNRTSAITHESVPDVSWTKLAAISIPIVAVTLVIIGSLQNNSQTESAGESVPDFIVAPEVIDRLDARAERFRASAKRAEVPSGLFHETTREIRRAANFVAAAKKSGTREDWEIVAKTVRQAEEVLDRAEKFDSSPVEREVAQTSTPLRPLAVSSVAGLPRYDPVATCRDTLRTIGSDSAWLEKACREQEQTSLRALEANWTGYPARARSSCRETMKVVGGSYWLLQACLEQEAGAIRSLAQ